jgi:hypothetical protein
VQEQAVCRTQSRQIRALLLSDFVRIPIPALLLPLLPKGEPGHDESRQLQGRMIPVVRTHLQLK